MTSRQQCQVIGLPRCRPPLDAGFRDRTFELTDLALQAIDLANHLALHTLVLARHLAPHALVLARHHPIEKSERIRRPRREAELAAIAESYRWWCLVSGEKRWGLVAIRLSDVPQLPLFFSRTEQPARTCTVCRHASSSLERAAAVDADAGGGLGGRSPLEPSAL